MFAAGGKLKAYELRSKSKQELMNKVNPSVNMRYLALRSCVAVGGCHLGSNGGCMVQLKELKTELGTLRVAKVTGGAPNKLAKMYAHPYLCGRSALGVAM